MVFSFGVCSTPFWFAVVLVITTYLSPGGQREAKSVFSRKGGHDKLMVSGEKKRLKAKCSSVGFCEDTVVYGGGDIT